MNIPTVNNIQIYITTLILLVATLTFLFGPGILEKKKLGRREKIMLKNHLKEFVSFWKNESRINDIDSERKELNKKGNEIDESRKEFERKGNELVLEVEAFLDKI